tara:strand:+ start:70043 stop:71077 length:1035 start_codon:yes stop_codon:yes gene_type:complete
MDNKENKDNKDNPIVAKVAAQTVTQEVKIYTSVCELSVRRKFLNAGLPGDDATIQNPKIGSSFKGKAPLSGLTMEEEKVYLPEIIGISPLDINWRKEVKDYWSNISERVPHDSEGTNDRLPGRYMTFSINFTKKADKEAFDKAKTFDAKAAIAERGEIHPEHTADYVLFRYCLKYSRVANNEKDKHLSAKIEFYLYSQEVEAKKAYGEFELRNQAREVFANLLQDSVVIDALLRVFEQNPDDTFVFPTPQDKHLKLDEFIGKNPKRFLVFANDKSLKEKAFIKEAVAAMIIYNPANTQVYYYGEDKQILMGNTLADAVLFLKSKEEKNVQVYESIKSQLHFKNK